jgi:hypothetical protein
MAIPSDLDGDPNTAKLQWEVVVRINPDTPFAAGAAPAIAAAILARGGVAAKSVTIDGAGTATVVLPDTGADVTSWVAWVASALAAIGRPGLVTGIGNRARVTA